MSLHFSVSEAAFITQYHTQRFSETLFSHRMIASGSHKRHKDCQVMLGSTLNHQEIQSVVAVPTDAGNGDVLNVSDVWARDRRIKADVQVFKRDLPFPNRDRGFIDLHSNLCRQLFGLWPAISVQST